MRRRTMLLPPARNAARQNFVRFYIRIAWSSARSLAPAATSVVVVFAALRQTAASRASRLSVCLPSPGPIPMPMREARFRERIYISRNRANFYTLLDGTDPKTKRPLSCQLSRDGGGGGWPAGRQTAPKKRKGKERGREDGGAPLVGACEDLSRQQRGYGKKKRARRGTRRPSVSEPRVSAKFRKRKWRKGAIIERLSFILRPRPIYMHVCLEESIHYARTAPEKISLLTACGRRLKMSEAQSSFVTRGEQAWPEQQ